jgi:hypothetical protein
MYCKGEGSYSALVMSIFTSRFYSFLTTRMKFFLSAPSTSRDVAVVMGYGGETSPAHLTSVSSC